MYRALLLADALSSTPAEVHAQLYKHLHEALLTLAIICSIAAVGAVIEKFSHLAEPLRTLGVHIPFWPTFVALVGTAIILAYPEIHDYNEINDRAGTLLTIETLQDDAMLEMLEGIHDTCMMYSAQRKLNEADALQLRSQGYDQQAEQVEASNQVLPPGVTCPPEASTNEGG